MKIGVLGTGMVGHSIGTKLIALGHDVKMGSRTETNEKAAVWVKSNGTKASQGNFAQAVEFAETMIFNCTHGMASVEILKSAGEKHLSGKILIDVANPLDFSAGMPPSLGICNTDSLGEQIQRSFPTLRVVKALNTMNCDLMVNPSMVPGDHNVFLSGNDAQAKEQVKTLLAYFGWKKENLIDLGDISTARGSEMLLPIWLRLWSALGNADFNFKIAR